MSGNFVAKLFLAFWISISRFQSIESTPDVQVLVIQNDDLVVVTLPRERSRDYTYLMIDDFKNRHDVPADIEFDARTGYLYWSDLSGAAIRRAYIQGRNPATLTVQDLVKQDIRYPYGLCGDFTRGKLYWTDSDLRKISSSDLDGSKMETLVSTDLTYPTRITVDPASQTLFWIDLGVYITDEDGVSRWNGTRIESLELRSGRRQTVLPYPYPRHPTSLEYDTVSERLYWTDTVRRTVESCPVNNCAWQRNRHVLGNTVYTDPKNGTKLPATNAPDGINILNDTIYWVEPNLGVIMAKALKSREPYRVSFMDLHERLMHVYNPAASSDAFNTCSENNGGCSQICDDSSGTPVCSCRDFYRVNDNDNSVCDDFNECEDDASLCASVGTMCVNTLGSYRCACTEGYESFGPGVTRCRDVDECETGTYCDQICINTRGSYRCDCEPGYTLNPDGETCGDVDECMDTSLCRHNCTNVIGSYRCTCQEGYVPASNGECEKLLCDESEAAMQGFLRECNITGGEHICRLRCDFRCWCYVVDPVLFECYHQECGYGIIEGDDTVTCDTQGQWQYPDAECVLGSEYSFLFPSGVSENAHPGQRIGVLESRGGDSLEYELLTYSDVFEIQESVFLVLAGDLDYEKQNYYAVEVLAACCRPGSWIHYNMTSTIEITVYDVNEQPSPPVLGNSLIAESQPGSPRGMTIGSLSTVDQDQGQTHWYRIIAQVNSRGQDASGTFIIVTNSELYKLESADFETDPWYGVTIQVSDDGVPALSNQNTFNITVSDSNERPYGLNISRNTIEEYTEANISDTRAGTVIGVLTVLDGDHAWLENHTLSIINADWQSANCFAVQTSMVGNPAQKEFRLLVNSPDCFDYEVFTSQTAYVLVRDRGGLELRTDVLVNVQDVNEPPTKIIFSAYYVMEHSPIGMPIGQLVAVDRDSPPERVTLSVTSQGNLVKLVNESTVLVNADYDYSQMQELTFTARATDLDTGLWKEEDITLMVRGEAVGPRLSLQIPELYQCQDLVCVRENLMFRTAIATCEVELQGGGSSYVLDLHDPSGHFSVNGNDVILSNELNYESGNTLLALRVTATDHNDNSATVDFNVIVSDANDRPTSVRLNNTLLPQQVRVGDVVGALTCVDEDPRDEHTFRITEDIYNSFRVEGNLLKVNRRLDRDEYYLIMTCSDRAATSPLSHFSIERVSMDGTDIRVTVTGTRAPETLRNGTAIGNISASLADGTEPVMFHFLLENEQYLPFTLTPVSNDLATLYKTGALDYEDQPEYNLVVKVTDIIHSRGHTFHRVTITVLDAHEPPTAIVLSRHVIEEGPPRNGVIDVSLIGPEPGTIYHMTLEPTGNAALSSKLQVQMLNESGARINAISAIDYESMPGKHLIRLRVTDALAPSIYHEQDFNITVLNVNEPPTAIQLMHANATSVAENTPGGTTVDRVIVFDPDGSSEQDDSFLCDVLQENYGWFVIDSRRNLKVGRFSRIDYEQAARRSVHVPITVQCFDAGSLHVISVLYVRIEDVNEPPSDIRASERVIQVQENQPAGTAVTEFSVFDPDVDETNMRYILDSDVTQFALQGATLVTTQVLDFETQTETTISVTAMDKGNLTFTKRFTVHIRDNNDPPQDIILPIETVDESLASGSVLGTIRVVDPDNDPFHNCVILKQTPAEALRIDYGTALSVNDASVIDYERYQQIRVEISCTDRFASIARNFTLAIRDNVDSFSIAVDYNRHVPENLRTGDNVSAINVRNADLLQNEPFKYPQISIQQISDQSTTEEAVLGVRLNRGLAQYEVFVLDGDGLSHEDQSMLFVRLHMVIQADHGVNTFNYTLMFNVTNVAEQPVKVVFYPTPELPLGVTQESLVNQGPYTGPVVINVRETAAGAGETALYYLYIVDEDIHTGQYHISINTVNSGSRRKRDALPNGVQSPAATPLEFYTRRVENSTMWYAIMINTSLDYEDSSLHELSIRVIDHSAASIQPLVQTLIIMITDVPEPPFGLSLSRDYILENSPRGTEIGVFNVHDEDRPLNGYRFRIIDSTAAFYVSVNSIYLGASRLNFERSREETVTIEVEEINSPVERRSFELKIQIDDVPEPPCCLKLYPGSYVYYNIPTHGLHVNYLIGYLGVLDEDRTDENITFPFRIVHVNSTDPMAASYFGIQNTNQLVLTQVPSDRILEAGTTFEYQVNIQTNDSTGLGYTGTLFLQFSDTCNGRRCSENGYCDMAGSITQCRCKDGYAGDGVSCEAVDACSLSPCQNGGTCFHTSQDNTVYLCRCNAPFTGENCQIDMGVCNSIECPYNGYCVPEVNGHSCECTEPYAHDCSRCVSNEGRIEVNCTEVPEAVSTKDDSNDNNTVFLAVLISVLVFLSLLFIVLAVLLCVLKRRREKPDNRRVRYRTSSGDIRVEPHAADDPNQFENPLYSRGSVSSRTSLKYINPGTQHFVDPDKKAAKNKGEPEESSTDTLRKPHIANELNGSTHNKATSETVQMPKDTNETEANSASLSDMHKALSVQEEVTVTN